MIIGISGKIGAGKDTAGQIIQVLTCDPNTSNEEILEILSGKREMYIGTTWHIKKFADKLKQCVSIITGIPREHLENSTIKNGLLPEEWGIYKFKAGNGEYYHFGVHADIEKYDKYGYDYEAMTVRSLLQKFGTEGGRSIHPDFWINALFADYASSDNWLITDMRFPNELQAVKNRSGITIRLTREGDTKSNHISETALDNATFDYVIDNNESIEDLILQIKIMLDNYGMI